MAKQSLEELRELLARQTPDKFLEAQNEAAFNAEQKSGGPSAEAPLLATYVYQLVQMYASRLKDALAMYMPLRGAEPFHASRAHIRLLLAGNQAGKTNAAAVEFSRILRGMDPYQKRNPGNLRCISVSKDGDHIGQVINRKLFMPGAFDIIRDEQTGLWRAVRPDPLNPRELDLRDVERKKDWYPAPPFIPPGDVAEWSYDNKKEQVLSLLRLRNGSEVLFKTSASNLMQGIEIDVAWLDEEVENKSWLRELQARCLKREGIIFWSFTPQAGTQQAYDLAQRGLMGDEDVKEFRLSLEENPYIPRASKDKLFRDLSADPEELRVRYYGDWAITGRRVYPTFSEATHCVEGFAPPKEWMRVLALDPGTSRPAALIAAVPPDGRSLHIYEEVYLRNVDARTVVEELAKHVKGYTFEAFVIDEHAARQHPFGMEKVHDHYAEEMRRLGLRSRKSGYGFLPGSDNVDARELEVKQFMRVREDTGQPTLLLHRQCCQNLIRQIKNRYYMKDRPDRREVKGEHDLVDCLEYLTAFFCGAVYYRSPLPAAAEPEPGGIVGYVKRLKAKQARLRPDLGFSGGGQYDWGGEDTTIYVGLG